MSVTSPSPKGELDSSFYTADNGADNGANAKGSNLPSPASSIGSAPVDSSKLRKDLYSGISTATGATEDTSLTDYMNKMRIQPTHSNLPTSRISFATDEDLYRIPEPDEIDQEYKRWQQHLDSEIAGLRSTAESTKEDTTKLLNKANEQIESAGMHHEDAMLGQEEIKELLEDQTEQGTILHEELSYKLDLLLELTSGGKKGNAAEEKKNRALIAQLKKEIYELKHKLSAAESTIAKMTPQKPQKPRRGLAPLPTNRPSMPATKRMVAAEIKHVGLKTDVALVDAEGVKRGNSSTLLP